MAVIAGISHNVVVGCLMGSFSVMLASVEQRMGVTREMSTVGGPIVIFGSALIASLVGPLMGKYSLRLLMCIGACLSLAGYLILAFTTSYPLYLASYALLFGPSMAIAGSVGPATLVTRWFNRNRGLALGLVHLSIVITVIPVLCNWMLEQHGAQTTYLMLAAIVGVCLVPITLMIRDHPPLSLQPSAAGEHDAEHQDKSVTVGQILKQPVFWALSLVAALIITSIMVLTFNMVPLAESLGIDRARGALLASVMAFSGMAGSVLFGWIADKIGGAKGLALLAFNSSVLLGLLLLDLPYVALAVVIGLLGLHGAGMIPNLSRALAHSLGREGFSRAFGMSTALSVPFTVIGIMAMATAFTRTGSYVPALLGVAVCLLFAVPIALWTERRTVSLA